MLEKIMLANPDIHKIANLKKEVFLDRISNIKYVRASDLFIDLFPHEEMEYSWLSDLYQIINYGNFQTRFRGRGGQIYGIEIQRGIYNWFKNNEISVIQKQILNWISAIYLHNKKHRQLIKESMYSLLFSEVENIISEYYKDDFDLFYDVEAFDFGEKYELYSNEYTNALMAYVGTSNYPPFLKNPFMTNYEFDQFGIKYSPKIKVSLGYFTEYDWIGIVKRDFNEFKNLFSSMLDHGVYKEKDVDNIFNSYGHDELERAESNKEFFEKWKYVFMNFDKTNDFEYKIINGENNPTNIYVFREGHSNIYKIGKSNDVERRRKGLQSANPRKLILVGKFKVASIKAETVLHKIFSSNRIIEGGGKEFFKLSEEDVQNILDESWRRGNYIF